MEISAPHKPTEFKKRERPKTTPDQDNAEFEKYRRAEIAQAELDVMREQKETPPETPPVPAPKENNVVIAPVSPVEATLPGEIDLLVSYLLIIYY